MNLHLKAFIFYMSRQTCLEDQKTGYFASQARLCSDKIQRRICKDVRQFSIVTCFRL